MDLIKDGLKLAHGWWYRLLMPMIVRPPQRRHGGLLASYPRAAIMDLLQQWQPRISGMVLDVGVGTWTYPRALLGGSCQYTATDCFEHANVDVVSDIHRLTDVFAPASFDFVICTDVLEHVPRPWLAVGQLCQVLKPGGRLLLTTPFNHRLHGNETVVDYGRFTEDGLRLLLAEEAGFSQVKITAVGHPSFPFSYAVVAVR